MKIQQFIITLFFLLMYNLCTAQLWYYKNTDSKTHRKLALIDVELLAIDLANAKMTVDVSTARNALRTILRRDYRRNRYDKGTGFLTQTGLRGAMAIGGDILSSTFVTNRTPYFTTNKRIYMETVRDNSLGLMWLQGVDPRTIKTADRQAIYRIRRKIIRTHSKGEGQTRRLILLAAVAYALQANADLDLMKLLKAGEILN